MGNRKFMQPIITVKNISKKYNIAHQRGGYVALRDVLTNIAKKPLKFLKHKAKEATGKAGKEEFWALKDINFTVEKGEVVGIIGANGAGKSTLLKILSQITPPTTGEIKINGRLASLLEVGTGFHPELSGRENIFLNGAILGMTKKEIAEKFDDIVKFAGIEKFIDTPVKRYSSGMYVRLAFSVAAHMEPDILLVDEVLAVGDAEFQKKCLGKMDEVTKQAGRTILFVSHNMGAIQNLCKKSILLEGGKIKMIGETKKIITEYLKEGKKDAKISISNRRDRVGSGDIKITDIQIFNQQNKAPIKSVISGQDVYMEITYDSKNKNEGKIDKAVFSVVFINETGQFVTALNSEMANKKFKNLSPKGKICCYIPNFPLMAGNYNIKISVRIDDVLADQIENAHTINVDNGDFFETGTKNEYNRQGVFIKHTWEKL